MVEDRITDGKRIAQLLASELTGLEIGPLATLEVVDADPDAEPTADGTVAYRLAVEDERVGTVRLFDDRAVLAVDAVTLAGSGARDADRADAFARHARGSDLDVDRTDDMVRVHVTYGAAVKRAVDALEAALD